MLIFIYNFHLSDIMACSGLLSEADEWKSSAGISRAEVCVGRHRAHSPPRPPVQQRPLLVMNDCIFTLSTCLQTRSIMRQLSSGDLYLFRVLPPDRRCYRLFLIAQPSVPTGPSSSGGVAPWKKHAEADAICINFQMEGVKACSATEPVCLKSAKAL